MTNPTLLEQSEAVVALLPRAMRQLFTLEGDQAAMELPLAQLRVCGVLRDGPRSMTVLSKELGISHSAVTQIADRLEHVGLVERVSEADDRRVRRLQLTTRGTDVMRARRERRLRRVMQVLDQMTPEERQGILNALQALLDGSLVIASEVPGDIPIAEQLES